MRTSILIPLILILSFLRLQATEGMWLPQLLQALNEGEMQSLGMKMSAEDIYSVNRGSLKDAIVSFGGYCTGELISDQGLLLTNHHCGYSRIQSHSTLENNYLQDGFWAMNRSEELPNPGLFVTFIVRIEDVTEQVFRGVSEDMDPAERQSLIDKNRKAAEEAAGVEPYQDVFTRPFFKGNQYFLFVTETYNDVRLVGAPPSSIGKFGADTDNWEWPRHTGDFALFRVYAGPDNKPADYAPENQPLRPKHFLPISLDGVAAGDFTLVFGFPGRTDQYLPSHAVQMQADVLNPIKIGIRGRTLEVLNAAMRADEEVRLQYASHQAGIANAWKKWIGESQGLNQTDAVAKKKAMEAEFQKRVNAKPKWKAAYGEILPRFAELYQDMEPYAKTLNAVSEITGRNVQLFRVSGIMDRLHQLYESQGAEALRQRVPAYLNYLEGFYEGYRPEIDQQVLASLLDYYAGEVNPDHRSEVVMQQLDQARGNYNDLAMRLFEQSLLARPAAFLAQLKDEPEAAMRAFAEDPVHRLAAEMRTANDEKVMTHYNRLDEEREQLQRTYMKALMEVFPEQRFYPDANGTLRVTYGQVEGYRPRDAIQYLPVTHLSGVIAKYQPGDYEFDLPKKLIELYEQKDYGPYATADGKMPVCFLGSNHTSGGNSGSPAIDAYGNLIGLNFDRVWEGTMSDLHYDRSICRNIMVDARYILFIIDKFAGAGHLIEEMKLVHPKK